MSRLIFKPTTQPEEEPISLAMAKKYLRQDTSYEDDVITELIRSARETVQDDTMRIFLTQEWTRYLDAFPCAGGAIRLPANPVQSITSIKYTDAAGDIITMDAADYILDGVSEPARILPAYGTTWPTTQGIPNAVEIIWDAGYSDGMGDPEAAMIPRQMTLAMYLLLGHWFLNREAVGKVGEEVALAYKHLIGHARIECQNWE